MRPYTSSGLATCSPPPHRSPALAWVGWCPNPIAPSWVGSPLPPLIFEISIPIPSDRDRAEPLGIPLLGLSTPSESPSAPSADLDALGAAAELHFGDSAARYSHADWERGQRAEPTCYAALRYILLGRPLALPTEVSSRFPSHQRPPFLEIQELAGKGRLHTTDEDIVLLVRIQPRPTIPYGLRAARLAFWGTNQSVFTCRYSRALGSCKPAIRLLPAI